MSDLIERLRKYVTEYGNLRGADTKIHGLHSGGDRECWIDVRDVSWMLGQIEAQQAEQARLRDHVENLCCLLEVIKEYWIDYDHVFTIGVGEARAELEQRQ